MIKFLREKLRYRIYRLLIKRYTKPRKEFLENTRALFIDRMRAHTSLVTNTDSHRIYNNKTKFSYSALTLLLFLLLNGGVILFAEEQNVDAEHPLYPFKRASEKIQIRLSKPEKKILLYEKFARRRLEELKQLKIRKNSEKIKKINKNLNTQLSLAIKVLRNGKVKKEKISVLCDSLFDIIKKQKEIIPEKPTIEASMKEECNSKNNTKGRKNFHSLNRI